MSITNQIVQQVRGGEVPAFRDPGPDLMRATFDSVDLNLTDLIRAAIRGGTAVIEGRTFINCIIEGPAVMIPLQGVSFEGTDFGYNGGDIRNLVVRPEGPKVIGAIAVSECRFVNCRFFAVGFTGDDAFRSQILSLGTPTAR